MLFCVLRVDVRLETLAAWHCCCIAAAHGAAAATTLSAAHESTCSITLQCQTSYSSVVGLGVGLRAELGHIEQIRGLSANNLPPLGL